MIDTLRFKAVGSEEIYKAIKNKGIERLIWDYEKEEQKHVLVYQLVPVPNRDYKIYVQASNYEHFFVEFSLPKILFGTNMFMIYPKQFTTTLIEVYRLVRNFLNFPVEPIDNWIVQRVDYSYVWKFDNAMQALWILQNMAKFQYPRKDLTIRDTSVTINGTSERMIFYLKHDEYVDVTYKKLLKIQPRLAEFLSEESKNTLRFEIVHMKAKLNSIFGREVTYKEVLGEEYIINTLNTALKTFCNSNTLISMTWHEAVALIYSQLPSREAFNIFGFICMYYPFDMAQRDYNREILKLNCSPSTIYKYKEKLKELGVGILFTNPEFKSIDLNIPNSRVINTEDQVAGIAEAIRDLRIV